jgi:tetratricopeptide (TPR) repeat protein
MRIRTGVKGMIAGGLLLLATGCESTQTAGGLDRALEDYGAGRYALASSRAGDAMRAADERTRAEAAYVAGLADYQLGRLDDAERRLLVATSATDRSVAAKATATLGLVRLQQHRPADAAKLLTSAASGLHGDDAREAARWAAAAFEQAGDHYAALTWVSLADTGVDDNRPTAGPGRGFVLQVGAFAERNRAERAAQDAAIDAERGGLGTVRIIARTDARGRRLHLVQMGSFASRRAAAVARDRIGRLDYIVTAASHP